jgi:hypothetical protein
MVSQPITRARESRPAGGDAIAADNVRAAANGYNIILRFRHRDLDPATLTSVLGWQPDRSWRAGEQAVTPKGTKLAAIRSDGLWSRSFRYRSKKHIADNLNRILDQLLPHKALFARLNEIGAVSALYVQLPGTNNIGGRIGWEVLTKLADLKIALEIEVFPNMDR